jgi:hypothetical protein
MGVLESDPRHRFCKPFESRGGPRERVRHHASSRPNSLSLPFRVPTCVFLLRLSLFFLGPVLLHIDLHNQAVPWPITAMVISKSWSDVVHLTRVVSPRSVPPTSFALFTLVNFRARARCKAAYSYVWKPNTPGSTGVGVCAGEGILGSRNRTQDDGILL